MEMEPVANENITLGCEEILKRGASDVIFKTYKPFQVMEYHAKWQGKNANTYFRTNAQSTGQADANVFTLELSDAKTKAVEFRLAIAISNKQQGKIRTSINYLTQQFGPDKKWLDLVAETKQRIEKERQDRGAPERPVFKPKEAYLREELE